MTATCARIWYPHYVRDFKAKTGHLTLAERGAYRALMDEYWERQGPLPADERILCRMIGAFPDEWAEVRESVLAFFQREGNQLRHPRIDEEIEKAQTKRRSAANNGKKGGRPKLRQTQHKTEPETQKKPSRNPAEKLAENSSPSPTHSPNGEISEADASSCSSADAAPPEPVEPKPTMQGVTSLLAEPIPSFATFWEAYPRRITEGGKAVRGNRQEAERKWGTMAPASKRAAVEGLPAFAQAVGDKPPDAIRYLRYRRWEDEIEDAPPQRRPATVHRLSAGERRRQEVDQAFDEIRQDIAAHGQGRLA